MDWLYLYTVVTATAQKCLIILWDKVKVFFLNSHYFHGIYT